MLQQQSCVISTENVCPQRMCGPQSLIFTIWTFTEKACRPCKWCLVDTLLFNWNCFHLMLLNYVLTKLHILFCTDSIHKHMKQTNFKRRLKRLKKVIQWKLTSWFNVRFFWWDKIGDAGFKYRNYLPHFSSWWLDLIWFLIVKMIPLNRDYYHFPFSFLTMNLLVHKLTNILYFEKPIIPTMHLFSVLGPQGQPSEEVLHKRDWFRKSSQESHRRE